MSLRPCFLFVTLFTQILHNLRIMQLSSGRNQADEAMQMPKYLIAVFLTVNSVALLLYTSLPCKLVCISLFIGPQLSQVCGAHTYGGTFPDAASRPVPCSDFSHFLLPFRTLGDGKWEEWYNETSNEELHIQSYLGKERKKHFLLQKSSIFLLQKVFGYITITENSLSLITANGERNYAVFKTFDKISNLKNLQICIRVSGFYNIFFSSKFETYIIS